MSWRDSICPARSAVSMSPTPAPLRWRWRAAPLLEPGRHGFHAAEIPAPVAQGIELGALRRVEGARTRAGRSERQRRSGRGLGARSDYLAAAIAGGALFEIGERRRRQRRRTDRPVVDVA